ncbi:MULTISPECIES: VOC family protein [unclassified Leptospira]|uniref:VOC family protein n=1 Tax=unclassified Leptospira TaxID=2633828 RepID=UPI0002BE1DFE|nr:MULTISPECIES: VOC family protein [unclassified Leptospira]EMK00269.1 putative lactoylglutathione lyase [Leptospira sp. B5-022]MCR1793717.1 VOC family protein [Leptospira sp. id769339]
MKYLHAMIRVKDLDLALDFFCNKLGLKETRRHDHPEGRYTLVFLSESDTNSPEIELTFNWDQDSAYTSGRNFGHLAFEVDNIYETCTNLQTKGVIINRPPRDGRMAFIRSPDLISIELLQKGKALEISEPWKSMPNTGEW